MTQPFVVAGRRLHVNVQIEAEGEVSIALCSQTPDPIADIAASRTIVGDQTDYVVDWPELDWTKQTGKIRRLQFHLKKAKLFSYWFD